MRKALPLTWALGGCALFTWLDSESLFFLLPRLPFVLGFLVWLVPLRWLSLRDPCPTPSATTPVFFSDPGGQVCQVLLGPGGVLAVECEYVD